MPGSRRGAKAAPRQGRGHYPFPVHLQDAYRGSVALAPDGLPVTEAIMPRILSLPMYPELSEADAVAVAGGVRDVVSSLTKERA